MCVTTAVFEVPFADTLSTLTMKKSMLSPDNHVWWEFVLLVARHDAVWGRLVLTLEAHAKAAGHRHDKMFVQAMCKMELHGAESNLCFNCRSQGYSKCPTVCQKRNRSKKREAIAEGPLCKDFFFSISGSVYAASLTQTSTNANDGKSFPSRSLHVRAQHFKGVAEPALLSPCNSSVVRNLEAMLHSGEMSDVTFVVGGEDIRAHRAILGAASDVFRAMFQHDTQDRRTGRVAVKDVGAAPFKEMLRCVYTDAAPAWGTGGDADDLLMGIFFLAEKYNLDALRGHCQRRILSTLTEDNVVRRIQSVNIISPFMVPLIADPFVRNHLTNILALPEWSDLMKDNAALAAKVMFNAMKR